VPAELDRLVLECLSKDPSLRPADADALWSRLDALMLGAAWDQARARAWWEERERELIHG